jgi:hypothetical protein
VLFGQHIFECITGPTNSCRLCIAARKLDPNKRAEDRIGAVQLRAAGDTGPSRANQLVSQADKLVDGFSERSVHLRRISLNEIATLFCVERFGSPIVNDVRLVCSSSSSGGPTVLRRRPRQGRQTNAMRACKAVTAGLVAERAGEPRFELPDGCVPHPLAGGEGLAERAIKPPRHAIVDVLDGGSLDAA